MVFGPHTLLGISLIHSLILLLLMILLFFTKATTKGPQEIKKCYFEILLDVWPKC